MVVTGRPFAMASGCRVMRMVDAGRAGAVMMNMRYFGGMVICRLVGGGFCQLFLIFGCCVYSW